MKPLSKNFSKRKTAASLIPRTFAAFLCVALFACASKLPTKEYTVVKADGEKIQITLEIAKTDKDRAKGFMERENIPDGTGMLFVFDEEQRLRFWMKNTPSPLSIAYIDKAGVIKEIHDLTPFSKEAVASAARLVCPRRNYERSPPRTPSKRVNTAQSAKSSLLKMLEVSTCNCRYSPRAYPRGGEAALLVPKLFRNTPVYQRTSFYAGKLRVCSRTPFVGGYINSSRLRCAYVIVHCCFCTPPSRTG